MMTEDMRYFYVNTSFDLALETHLILVSRGLSLRKEMFPSNVLGITSESRVFAFTLNFGRTVREIFDVLYKDLEIEGRWSIFEFSSRIDERDMGDVGYKGRYDLQAFLDYLLDKGGRGVLLNPMGESRPLVDLGYLTIGSF